MQNIYRVLILGLALAFASRTVALEVQEYKELKEKSIESKEIIALHINGVGRGYSLSNLVLKLTAVP